MSYQFSRYFLHSFLCVCSAGSRNVALPTQFWELSDRLLQYRRNKEFSQTGLLFYFFFFNNASLSSSWCAFKQWVYIVHRLRRQMFNNGLYFFLQSTCHPPWQSDRVLGYLPLSELDSGLGCGPDSPHHQVPFSEAETDAMSSLPGYTPSSQGSTSSSESLISSEPSDSGFHSVSTGEHRRLHKIHGSHSHRQTHHLRSGHSPREQRGRWDLESIPETTPVTHSGAPQPSHCTVGNSTTTTVHFHRAERSPTLSRHCSPPSPSAG